MHAVTDKRVKRLRLIVVQGKILLERRRENISDNALPMQQMALVHKNISSFPARESCCSGRDFKCPHPDLTLKKASSMFRDLHRDK
jgi:hypothetical protein